MATEEAGRQAKMDAVQKRTEAKTVDYMEYPMGIFPYAMAAAIMWPHICMIVPADILLVVIFTFALIPWWGLAPGLTPILLLGRLRGWIPHPWAAKQRSHTHALLLVVISPILIPAVFAAIVMLFWPIHNDWKRYRESTGEAKGGEK